MSSSDSHSISSLDPANDAEFKLRIGMEDESLPGDASLLDPFIPSPPDGGFGWVVVAASFLANCVVDGICYSFGLLLPHLQVYLTSLTFHSYLHISHDRQMSLMQCRHFVDL